MKIKSTEKVKRSAIKSVTYRVMSITADSMAAYFFTRDAALSAGIVIFVNGYSMILYYFHERIWSHIRWGRRKDEELN